MSYQLPPLDDENRFERLVRDLLRRVYRDPAIERFGRDGQNQSGIDGFASVKSPITFQCKLKDVRYRPDSQVRAKLLSDMEEELKATVGLAEPPTRFVFASTFKNDREMQEKAQSLSSDVTKVEYWGWDTISERVWEYAEELIPVYYPQWAIKRVTGFRQITHQLIEDARAIDDSRKNVLALDYYRINDRAELVFQVVCNGIDVRNSRVMETIYQRLDNSPANATLWVLGAGGSGKTTILHRTAVELAQQDRTVFTLDLEAHLSRGDLESILSIIKYSSEPEGCVLCIDNPAADEGVLESLLREIPNYTSSVHVILAERVHRYKGLRRIGILTYLHGEEEREPIYVRNPRSQREDVYERLFTLLAVPEEYKVVLLNIVRNEDLVYVNATYRILLELKKKELIDFDFDWDDYRKSTSDLPAFREAYKYIALFYLFGVRTPFQTFSRICGADEAQQRLFLEKFRGLVNEPIVVDERRDESQRKIVHLRTKHEIVSEIFFGEHSELNKDELLTEWVEQTNFDDAVETQALINIFGAKKNYLPDSPLDLGSLTDFLLTSYISDKIKFSPKLYATQHLAKAWLLLNQNQVSDAIAVLISLLQIQPDNLHCRTELAKIYQRQGKLEDAERTLLEILTLKPTDLNARTELAKIYQRTSRLAEAESILLQVLGLNPRDLNSRTELAKVYRRQGRLNEAESVLLELLEIEKRSIWARTELAKVYQRQNKLGQAERVLLEVLKISRNDLNSRTELAKIYQRQGKLKEAEELLLESLAIDDQQLHPRTELAKVYQRQGKLKEAEELLLESLAIDDQQLHPRTELAKVYQRQGKLKEAEELLLESLAIDDQQLHPRTELAKIYQRQGKLKEAEELLLELLQLEAADLQARTELAKIYQRQGKLEEAEERLLESLAIDPQQLHPRTELAKIYQRQGKLEEAEERLLESLAIDPQQLHPRTELAKIYQRQGKLEEAEERLLESLAIDPQQLHPRTELAKIYQRQGKLEEAEERLLESLAIDPQQLHPRTELAKIYQRQGKLKEAEERLLESIAIDPQQLHPRTELAKIYQRQGKIDLAIKRLEEYIALDPKGLHPRTELAKIYQRQGRLDLAAKYAEESLSIDSLNDHAISEMIAIWTRQNEGEKCVQRFMEFIGQPNYRFSRSSQAPVYRFFQCCRRFHMSDAAKTVFDRFRSELDERNTELFHNVFGRSNNK